MVGTDGSLEQGEGDFPFFFYGVPMKLQTAIPPRKDGTVIVRGADGRMFAFVPNDDGELVGEVDDEALAAQLLAGGLFFAADVEAAPTPVRGKKR